MLKTWWARLFKAKRPFKLTKPGWIFILYTIGVGAGAVNTGNNLLYLVFGVFLGLILASGFLSDLSLWGIDVEPTFPLAAAAGEPFSIFLKVSNGKRWFPSLSAVVSLEGSLRGEPVRLRRHVPFVGSGGSEPARVEWTPAARGRYRLDHIRLSTRFPFGLLEKWWRRDLEDRAADGLFVTPRIFLVVLRLLPLRAAGEDKNSEEFRRGDGSVLMGLHAFAPGDNPRRIHWKSTAKRASAFADDPSAWLVREMNKDEREEILFILPDPESLAGLSDAEVESRASFLASALAACRDHGMEVRVVAEGRFVVDEPAFLALWDPREKMDPALRAALGQALPPYFGATAKRMDVEEAYRVSHAG